MIEFLLMTELAGIKNVKYEHLGRSSVLPASVFRAMELRSTSRPFIWIKLRHV